MVKFVKKEVAAYTPEQQGAVAAGQIRGAVGKRAT